MAMQAMANKAARHGMAAVTRVDMMDLSSAAAESLATSTPPHNRRAASQQRFTGSEGGQSDRGVSLGNGATARRAFAPMPKLSQTITPESLSGQIKADLAAMTGSSSPPGATQPQECAIAQLKGDADRPP
jgi:hypothetical protein